MPQIEYGIWAWKREHDTQSLLYEIWNKAPTLQWDHETYLIMECGKRKNMKLEAWNKVILKLEIANL